ncbi:MAG: MmcQ/YjbR family DNA-binding protein [Lachnospiraceae bacterium]|nr:MmcQ/YjbR family DNA-binding protein [Lachnospiraceae bacterium]
MKRSEVIKIINETYSVEAEYLWDGETHAVFRHPASNKWFGIIMEVKKKNLHISGYKNSDETEDVMNVKANPILIEDLLHEETFLPAYHMNKKYWVSIRLKLVTKDALKKLIDESWNLIKPKVKKRG